MATFLTRRVPALALVALAVVQVSAQPKDDNKIEVRVVAILAHNKDGETDPRLKLIAAELQKAVPQLKVFTMGKQSCKSVAVGATEKFELVDDQVAVVTLVQAADKDNLVQVKLAAPQMTGEVTYETTCGQFFPVITKYRAKDKNNSLLIVAVCVRPCAKGK